MLDGQEAVRGQVALRELGLSVGTPIVNVESACASGSSAVYIGRKVAEAGDRVLVVGAEKMYQADKRRTLAALAIVQDVTQVDRKEVWRIRDFRVLRSTEFAVIWPAVPSAGVGVDRFL